jgi:enamine deaminase RidA (YjgF/YER057c/UK114 family)
VIERINPSGVHVPQHYHQAVVVQPGAQVLLSGQCPLDPEGRLVGDGDVAAQAAQVARNIGLALDAVGAAPSDVVRTTVHVRSDDRADLVAAWHALVSSPVAAAFTSASTLVGVAQLGYAGQLVEVDVVAVLPA